MQDLQDFGKLLHGMNEQWQVGQLVRHFHVIGQELSSLQKYLVAWISYMHEAISRLIPVD